MLDLRGLRYTHSGLATSGVAIDKQLTKQTLVPHGIPMPGGRIVKSADLYEADPLARPYVLKPVNEGSSVGVAIVTDDGNYRSEEHTSELQSLMRISYAVFCLKKTSTQKSAHSNR